MISVQNLNKYFQDFQAVKDLSFELSRGQVLGFLGPNGAGKTTTMRMIAGFLAPTSGQIIVAGHDVQKERLVTQSLMGYLPEGSPLYGDMTVRQFLNFVADMRELGALERRQRIGDVSSGFELDVVHDQCIQTLSKGYRRRVGFAQALLHDPAVLILDEPTDGLDPNQKHQVRQFIQTIAQEKAIIISTHILEEVHALCSRLILFNEGQKIVDETPTDFLARSAYCGAVVIETETPLSEATLAQLRALEDVQALQIKGKMLCVMAKNKQIIWTQVQALLEQAEVSVKRFEIQSGRLDEVFYHLTTGLAWFDSDVA